MPRKSDAGIKYRGSWAQLSNIVSFVAAKPPAHRYRIIVPFVFQVSVKFPSASQPSSGTLECSARSVRNKGSKDYPRPQLYLSRLFILFRLVPFTDSPRFFSPSRSLPCLRSHGASVPIHSEYLSVTGIIRIGSNSNLLLRETKSVLSSVSR